MMKKYLAALLTSIIASSNASAFKIQDDPDFTARSLDDMIEHSAPMKEGTVDLTLFKKVSFDAQFVTLPKKSKTQYLQSVLKQFNIKLAVNHKTSLKSANGKVVKAYIPDDVVKQITSKKKIIELNKSIKIYAYHVYNSKHGPGFLITGFE